MRDIKECWNALIDAFPGSYINDVDEFIAHHESNEYIILGDCENELDIRCKVLEWFSRPACKTAPYAQERKNKQFQEFMREGVNEFLDTQFTEKEMSDIYGELGNAINHDKTIEFIESGYDFTALGKELNQQEEIKGCSGECDLCPDADGCEQCGSV